MERMKAMVRKQFLIRPEQDRALKSLAQRRNTSEAALIREALDQVLAAPKQSMTREEAVASFLAAADQASKTHHFPEGYRFNREELYEERLNRRFPPQDEDKLQRA
jgi:hypothetical protein